MIQEIRKPVEKYFEQYILALDKAMYSDNPMLQNIAEHVKNREENSCVRSWFSCLQLCVEK